MEIKSLKTVSFKLGNCLYNARERKNQGINQSIGLKISMDCLCRLGEWKCKVISFYEKGAPARKGIES
jgi:hypothetical protein